LSLAAKYLIRFSEPDKDTGWEETPGVRGALRRYIIAVSGSTS
jgi:hypothetical protein